MSSHSFTNVVKEANRQELWHTMDNLNKESGNEAMGSLTYNFTCLPSPHSPQSHTYNQPSLLSSLPNHGSCFKKQKKKKQTNKKNTPQNQPNKQNDLSPEGLESSQRLGLWRNVRLEMEKAHTKDCLEELSTGDDPQGRYLPSKYCLHFFSASFCCFDWNSPKKRIDFRGFRTVSPTK